MIGTKVYTIHLVTFDGYKDVYRSTKVNANHITEDDRYFTFYDEWNNCVGRFRKDAVLGFGVEA